MMTKKSEGSGSLDQLVTLSDTLKRQRAMIKYCPADALSTYRLGAPDQGMVPLLINMVFPH